jgi:hypothetical protein
MRRRIGPVRYSVSGTSKLARHAEIYEEKIALVFAGWRSKADWWWLVHVPSGFVFGLVEGAGAAVGAVGDLLKLPFEMDELAPSKSLDPKRRRYVYRAMRKAIMKWQTLPQCPKRRRPQ